MPTGSGAWGGGLLALDNEERSCSEMTNYRVIVVGTDGSPSWLRAVDEAARIAADAKAKLVVATVFSPSTDSSGAPDPDQPDDDHYLTHGNAAGYAKLHEAVARAQGAGVESVVSRTLRGAPASALVALGEEVGADLLVVGSEIGRAHV